MSDEIYPSRFVEFTLKNIEQRIDKIVSKGIKPEDLRTYVINSIGRFPNLIAQDESSDDFVKLYPNFPQSDCEMLEQLMGDIISDADSDNELDAANHKAFVCKYALEYLSRCEDRVNGLTSVSDEYTHVINELNSLQKSVLERLGSEAKNEDNILFKYVPFKQYPLTPEESEKYKALNKECARLLPLVRAEESENKGWSIGCNKRYVNPLLLDLKAPPGYELSWKVIWSDFWNESNEVDTTRKRVETLLNEGWLFAGNIFIGEPKLSESLKEFLNKDGIYYFKGLALCIRAIPNFNKPLSDYSHEELMEELCKKFIKPGVKNPEERMMDKILNRKEGEYIPDLTEELGAMSERLSADDKEIWGPIMENIDRDILIESERLGDNKRFVSALAEAVYLLKTVKGLGDNEDVNPFFCERKKTISDLHLERMDWSSDD